MGFYDAKKENFMKFHLFLPVYVTLTVNNSWEKLGLGL